VITDFTAHPIWAFPHVDRYFVASDEVATELATHGVAREHIEVTGIPVDPRFAVRIGRDAARRRVGLAADRPAVLIMGGGSGVGPLAELALRLADLDTRPQIAVVCGTNARLAQRLETLLHARQARGAAHDVTVLGFTRDVDVWLEACDLLVGKAGGLTCSEALVKGTPLVIFKPTPGQEVRNAEYLERHEAAVHADTVDDVRLTVERWLRDPAELERRRAAALALGRPHAAETIARQVLDAMPEAIRRLA
jgi:processive 1,2-diacylglycerol beta-glucosyltransferase